MVHVKVILSAGILSQGKECACHLVTAVVEETAITSSQLRNAMMPVLLLGVSIKPSCHSYIVSVVISNMGSSFFSKLSMVAMGHRTSSPSGMSGESYGAKVRGKMDMLL